MAVLVDSSVLIALERRGLSPDTVRRTFPDETVALSAITASELLVGVHRAATSRQRLRREAFVRAALEMGAVLPVDLQVARIHADLWATLQTSGRMVGAHDLLIAATAMAYGYDVLTANVRDFGSVPGLTVRQPTW